MFRLYILVFLAESANCFAQADTVLLREFTVESYFIDRPVLRLPVAASIIDSARMQESDELADAINSVPGVRMEERSPGSYRLSVRGSLLRSPFGIRNIKIYIEDFPFTDAGGNTYINLLDHHAIKRMEIIKGPDGSLFGANSGGVVRISAMNEVQQGLAASAMGKTGSYEKREADMELNYRSAGFVHNLYAAAGNAEGYREHSAMMRRYVHLNEAWDYSLKGRLSLFAFYSHLNYLTPGGLTVEQYVLNRKSPRPSGSLFPGAVEQKAGITNKTVFAGIKHDITINEFLRHVFTVSGSVTAFSNPFITNYEVREEKNRALRSWFHLGNNRKGEMDVNLFAGVEGQLGYYEVTNYGNRGGVKDTLQSGDSVAIRQGFAFIQLTGDLYNKVQLEGSVSLNRHAFDFRNAGIRTINAGVMPRFAASWLITDHIAWRVSASKGFSPPTFAEVRASDQEINAGLDAESGWNLESGIRLRSGDGNYWIDVCAYKYNLKDAIVRRLNDNGNEYFINAGGTRQNGAEVTFNAGHSPHAGIIGFMRLSASYSLSDYRFIEYRVNDADYSGCDVTGVPLHDANADIKLELRHNIYWSAGYHFTSSIPMNDANSVTGEESHVVYLKAGWRIKWRGCLLTVSSGVNNLFNEMYSAGYDLNAAGGRYYNAAPERNYYLQLNVTI